MVLISQNQCLAVFLNRLRLETVPLRTRPPAAVQPAMPAQPALRRTVPTRFRMGCFEGKPAPVRVLRAKAPAPAADIDTDT